MKRAALLGIGLAMALSLPAAAADQPGRGPMITKGPVMAPMPYYNWTGFYIGGHVGYGWSDKDWNETTAIFGPGFINSASYEADGFLGGGQIGFNWQTGPWVFGIELDASWTDINGGGAQLIPTFFGGTASTDINWIGTVTGRVGYAWNNMLLYGKAGFAWADEDHNTFYPGVGSFTSGETRTGWIVGAGIEYGFWNNWSAKLEYNYIDLGTENVGFADGIPSTFDIDQQIHVVKVGLNYRFGWFPGPVVARY